MPKSPAQSALWLLIALLALWSTRLDLDVEIDGFVLCGTPSYTERQGYSVLRSGFMAEAHPLPDPHPPAHCPPPAPADIATNETRAFIESLFTAVALDNFGSSFAAALSDALVWTVTGSSPIAGTYGSKQIYIDEVLTPLRDVLVVLPVPIVEHIVVDGEWAVVNWRSEGARGKNGANYDMQYAWVLRTAVVDENGEVGRKIVEVIGFYDGQKVAAVFEGYTFEKRGA